MQNQSSSSNQTYIKDLKPNLKNINLQAIVLDICKPTQTKDGNEVRSVRIADRSGSINLSVWNNYGSLLKEGDIIKLTGCYTQIWKLSLQLKISTKGTLFKCGDFMMVFSEQPDMSVLSSEALKMVQEQQAGGKPSNNNSNSNNNSSTVTSVSNNGNNNVNVGNYQNNNNSNAASWR